MRFSRMIGAQSQKWRGEPPWLRRQRQRPPADAQDAQPGRQHQTLLAAADHDVDAPLVHPEVDAGQRADRIDDQQRVVAGGVHRLADGGDVARHARRRLVVDDHHRAIRIGRAVRLQPLLDVVGGDRLAPAQLDLVDLEAELAGDDAHAAAEDAVVEDQHAVARRQRVDQRGLGSASTRCGVEHRRAVARAEHAPQSDADVLGQLGEFRAAVVDDRPIHRPQHAVGDVGRSRNLQERRVRS